jgi:alkaline phosphatase D
MLPQGYSLSRPNGSRRRFLKTGAATAAAALLPDWALKGAPAIVVSAAERPQALQGLQFGDPYDGAVVVWSRSVRPPRMLIDCSYDQQFQRAQRVVGPYALDVTDFTVRQDLTGLEPGRDVFVRVTFQGLHNDRAVSQPVTGRFVVPPAPLLDGRPRPRARGDIRFLWSGDVAGQGFGINTGFGGMKAFEAMRLRKPLFFIHSGDTIYADSPIASSLAVEDGKTWTKLDENVAALQRRGAADLAVG